MFISLCSNCGETSHLIRTALEQKCQKCKQDFDDYTYISISKCVLASAEPEDTSYCFQKITNLMESGCLFVEVKDRHTEIEICCSPEMQKKVSKLLTALLKKGGGDVIELPKKFSVPPLLEQFYPHSRERAESIIEAMNKNRNLLVSRFSDDSEFRQCPEGFLFVYVDDLVNRMQDPVTAATIEKKIKNHLH